MNTQKCEPGGAGNAEEPFRPRSVAMGQLSLQSPLRPPREGHGPCESRVLLGWSQSRCGKESSKEKHSRDERQHGNLGELSEPGMAVQRDAPRLDLIRRQGDERIAQIAHLLAISSLARVMIRRQCNDPSSMSQIGQICHVMLSLPLAIRHQLVSVCGYNEETDLALRGCDWIQIYIQDS